DGIRDFHVTGVQTCALPIFEQVDEGTLCEQRGESDTLAFAARERGHVARGECLDIEARQRRQRRLAVGRGVAQPAPGAGLAREQIGRASCRESGWAPAAACW